MNGELDRTCRQLEAFGDLLEDGSYVEAIISTADPRATPTARPDVRRMLIPIGPVAVFTPSNFPLAFGVAGGDTASALAAGCPVIVKGHPAHGGTSEACARALETAAAASGVPPGVLSLLQAHSIEPARALVEASELEAIAFTGSQTAGRAIHDLAAARARPIPVYAEMGSVNPVFIGRDARTRRSASRRSAGSSAPLRSRAPRTRCFRKPCGTRTRLESSGSWKARGHASRFDGEGRKHGCLAGPARAR